MYEAYWGFEEKPFRNTPNPRYLYVSQGHEEALTRLLYVVAERKGGMLLTGDYGCGKTLMGRVLLRELSPERYEMAIVANPDLSPVEFLQETLYQFGVSAPSRRAHQTRMHRIDRMANDKHPVHPVDPCKVPAGAGKPELFHRLEAFVRACAREGRHPVLIVDEAQMVRDAATLEEMRLLLNLQRDDEFLLTLILSGQPELRGMIDDLPQFKQRLTLRYHLGPLDEAETALYLRYRLSRAGAERPIFTRDAERALYRISGGVPRELNGAADLALLVGCGRGAKEIGSDLVHEIARDLAA